MKNKHFIISLLLLGLINMMALPIVPIFADEGPPAKKLTEPEKACQNKKKDYKALEKAWGSIKQKNQNAYKKAFEDGQLAHHLYVGCLFHFAEGTVLMSDGNKPGGTADANLANAYNLPLFGMLIDWMTPDQACLTPDALNKLIQDSEPSQLLPPILGDYSEYEDYVDEIGKDFDVYGRMVGEGGKSLSQIEALQQKSVLGPRLKRERKMEIEHSLMAINMMFTSLKELRLSLVMHVHFQCTLQYLEKYRKALEELRSVIDPLPTKLNDASVSK